MHILLATVLLCLLVPSIVALNATIYYTSGVYHVAVNVFDPDNGVATAIYNDNMETTGWIKLHISTNAKYADAQQAYAAGVIEGYLTQDRIFSHWNNLNTYTWQGKGMPEHVKDFLRQQAAWTSQQIKANPHDNYWQQVNTVFQQYAGLVYGYNNVASAKNQTITAIDMHTITSFGDLFEIAATKGEYRPDFNKMPTEELINYLEQNGHCSGLIKLADDLSDIFFGHTSWYTYAGMTRIFKEYQFNYNNPMHKAKRVVFSSYPANLGSNDDFYLTSQNLAVIETTNGVLNDTLFDLIKPSSLLCWQRVVLANFMATTSEEWVKFFATHNSGTYNNQYFALDLKKFKPGVSLDEGALWVAEQIPGFVDARDVTEILQYGYWPSYNVPFSKYIFKVSGFEELLKKNPAAEVMMSYEHCVRANIFRRDQTNVTSIDSMKRMMRYNNYQVDPLSMGDPGYAIASRFDLRGKGSCSGGYDTKISSYKLAKDMQIEIINGPTYDDVPAFEFNGQCSDRYAHAGLPKTWQFPWQSFKPKY